MVLAWTLAPWAVALFNPAVALALAITGRLDIRSGLLCAAAQIAGAVFGVMIAHLVTNTGLVQTASQIHGGIGVWTGEALATGLLVLAVLKALRQPPERLALAAGIAALAMALATPSLSLANPAITLGRALTDSFTAIRLEEAATICAVQLLAALAASVLLLWLSHSSDGEPHKAGSPPSRERHSEGKAV
jgi:glycerol uptake facilitator-like aquaporin